MRQFIILFEVHLKKCSAIITFSFLIAFEVAFNRKKNPLKINKFSSSITFHLNNVRQKASRHYPALTLKINRQFTPTPYNRDIAVFPIYPLRGKNATALNMRSVPWQILQATDQNVRNELALGMAVDHFIDVFAGPFFLLAAINL